METRPLLVGGELTHSRSGETFDAVNPATGETIARVPRCGPADVDAAVTPHRRRSPIGARSTRSIARGS